MIALAEIAHAAVDALSDRDTWIEGAAIALALVASSVIIALYATAPV